jgi:Icc-related predicted phosphoesterase
MKLRLASDLHFEFHADQGEGMTAELVAGAFDVLVIAGDLCDFQGLAAALRRVARAAAPRPVVYVLGNHEFYGGDRGAVIRTVAAAVSEHPNLHWLEGCGGNGSEGQDLGVVTLGGHRFVGTTLWFAHHPNAPQWAMNDFSTIRGFRAWVYNANREAQLFLRDTVQPGDVVVTHHLPAERSVAPQFRGSALNAFFLCSQQALMLTHKPALWCHGHTHVGADYRIGETRVVCNPFGYPGEKAMSWAPLDIDV